MRMFGTVQADTKSTNTSPKRQSKTNTTWAKATLKDPTKATCPNTFGNVPRITRPFTMLTTARFWVASRFPRRDRPISTVSYRAFFPAAKQSTIKRTGWPNVRLLVVQKITKIGTVVENNFNVIYQGIYFQFNFLASFF